MGTHKPNVDGSISARAEEPQPSHHGRYQRAVDLRAGGGAVSTSGGTLNSPGRSPRGLRSRVQQSMHLLLRGSISARAEEPY